MNSRHLGLLILLILGSAANFLGWTGRHDSLCLDSENQRLEWCYPHERHLVPTIDNSTLAREVLIVTVAGIAWVRVAKKPE